MLEHLRHFIALSALFGALSVAAVSSPGHADDTPNKEEKPDGDEPKEKKAVTVPAGTALMIKTGEKVTSDDKPGRRFSATLQANLLAGDTVVAEAGSQVYGTVVSSGEIGRGIVAQHSNLKLALTDINVEGTMYPIITSSFSEKADSVILKRRSVIIPAGSLLEFTLKQPLTVKK